MATPEPPRRIVTAGKRPPMAHPDLPGFEPTALGRAVDRADLLGNLVVAVLVVVVAVAIIAQLAGWVPA